ncbi:alpha/beta fold hydrolase, partial [Actinospica durhamensis]
MRLATREWGQEGEGPRPTALLVHGIMSDSRTWRLVGPALAERGYHVIAVDLRGHGVSARDGDYSPAAYAADLVETMADFERPALAVGHSLGGLALRHAVDALRPDHAVYVDPAWRLSLLGESFDPDIFIRFADAVTAQAIITMNPTWALEDVEVELATLACWDRQTATALAPLAGTNSVPESAPVPSLI